MNDVKSAARVLDLLELFSTVQTPLGVSDVARRLAIPKSSAQGLLVTLATRGYLERVGSAYLLPESLKKGQWIGGPRAHLLRVAQPVLDQAAEASGETAFLGVMDRQWEIAYLAKAVGAMHPVRYDASLEHTRPCHSTSIGHIILAQLPPERLEEYLRQAKLRALTERTVTDKATLRDLVQRAKRNGYAESRETNIAGVCGVSAPVFGPDGQVVAGLNLGAPTLRFNKVRADLIRIAMESAADLSARLGALRRAA